MTLTSVNNHRKNVHEQRKRREDPPFRASGNHAPKELKTLTTAERPVSRM